MILIIWEDYIRGGISMKKRSTVFALFGMVLLLSMFLVACGGDGSDGTTEGGNAAATAGQLLPPHIEALINREMPTSDDVEPGGILRFARVEGSPFSGILHPLWSNAAMDSNIQDFFLGDMTTVDEEFLTEIYPDGHGAAMLEISEDGLTATFTIREGVYWHDGTPVTAYDWLFAYEVLASPEYAASGGLRFGQQNERSIVGILDFHEGNVDYIAGIEVHSDRVISFTYEEIVPIRNTFFMHPLPVHIFGDIPIEEMEDSIYVRTTAAIGFGPFILDTMTPGESVTLVRNDNYWQGAPLLDGIEYRIVSPATIGEELRAGTVDIAHTFQESQFGYFEDLSNVTFLKNTAFVYTYIGFRVGYWDMDLGQSVLNPDATMADVNLRRAMWMAIDNDLVSQSLFSGLRWDASSLVPPAFSGFHNSYAQRPPFDLDAANALLDEAGYEIGADGYRMNPDGSPLEIRVIGIIRDENYEAAYQYYLTQWRELSLNIEITEMLELAAFGALFSTDVDADHFDVMLGGAWSTGTNPSPYGLYGRTAAFNRSRYVSERNDELLARIDSPEAVLDEEYRIQAFHEWQDYMIENASLFPTQFRLNFIPVNNRVVNFEIQANHNPMRGWHLVGLTEDAPIVD